MEEKTNKAKLDIFNFLENWLNCKAAFDKISLLRKFNKYSLTRVFLHAEFISAMKTVQNPTVLMETQK